MVPRSGRDGGAAREGRRATRHSSSSSPALACSSSPSPRWCCLSRCGTFSISCECCRHYRRATRS
ncbi:hypothetical protein BDA96_10G238800 [Sorghum bicolor]|uniref:Uncharacterized protein n=2 Tax=Sorghum bicolor TaxID=4558 RepID=A0A921Q488_SORBI|nr:hypothetical protein BDA96_10G238800 [Sorghum bicolor]OQU76663.1 hypothetical protein SORBI_3010G181701 [Sorghum bicolor]